MSDAGLIPTDADVERMLFDSDAASEGDGFEAYRELYSGGAEVLRVGPGEHRSEDGGSIGCCFTIGGCTMSAIGAMPDGWRRTVSTISP